MIITIGKWEKIGGVDSYVATPAGDYPQNKAILFLSDAFGPQLKNNQVRSFTTLMSNALFHKVTSYSLTILLLTASKLVALLLMSKPSYFRPI